MANISKANLQAQFNRILDMGTRLSNYKLNTMSFELLSILLGFFTSTALSTIPAQTGDWGIAAAVVVVVNQEIVSRINYQNHASLKSKIGKALKIFLKYCNSIKIGILYGLFVDAFKLGS